VHLCCTADLACMDCTAAWTSVACLASSNIALIAGSYAWHKHEHLRALAATKAQTAMSGMPKLVLMLYRCQSTSVHDTAWTRHKYLWASHSAGKWGAQAAAGWHASIHVWDQLYAQGYSSCTGVASCRPKLLQVLGGLEVALHWQGCQTWSNIRFCTLSDQTSACLDISCNWLIIACIIQREDCCCSCLGRCPGSACNLSGNNSFAMLTVGVHLMHQI